MDDGRTSQDEEDVEDVGADDVSERQLPLFLDGGGYAGGQLRHGRAAGQDGDGDELVAHPECLGNMGGRIYEPVAAEDEGGKAEDNPEHSLPQGHFLRFWSLLLAGSLAETPAYVEGEDGDQDEAVPAGQSVGSKAEERVLQAQADEKKRDEMEKAATEAELVALKSQVNPHFLFNTLNNIYSLIQIDQDKAQEAVHDLSGMLRYVLYDSEKPSVPLSKETGFLKDYIKLMSMRCSSNVTLDVSLPETDSDKHVAPLLFIPLVENAFKHGISTSEPSSIKIELKEEGEYVSFLVENTSFPKNDSDRSGSGIGVKNLQRRLDMLYPGQHSFEYGETQGFYRSFLKIKTGNT